MTKERSVRGRLWDVIRRSIEDICKWAREQFHPIVEALFLTKVPFHRRHVLQWRCFELGTLALSVV
jgi:hypothetical protein